MVFIKGREKRNQSKWLVFFLSCMVFTNVFAMKRPPLGTEEGPETKKQKVDNTQQLIEQKVNQQVAQLKANEYLLYNPETGDGVAIPKNSLMLSVAMQHLINDFEMAGYTEKKIPLNFSIKSIKILQDILLHYGTMRSTFLLDYIKSIIFALNLSELVDMMNLVIYLDLPDDIRQAFVSLFTQRIMKMSFQDIEKNQEALNLLNPDIKKEIIFSIVKPYVEKVEFRVMSKKTKGIEMPSPVSIHFNEVLLDQRGDNIACLYNDRKAFDIASLDQGAFLWRQETTHPILAISLSNNNKIAFAIEANNKINFIVQDFITQEQIGQGRDNNFNIESFQLSPDGKIIAILHNETIELWDISDFKNINQLSLTDEKNQPITTAACFAFSPDSKHILIGCESKNDSENLFLYDISDIANIKRKQVLNRDKAKIFSVGWCLDGTRCFSISDKATNNFILWDFIDKEKLHPSSFDKQVPEVIKCSLSSDGKRLVVLELPSANIVLWDLNNIHEPVNKIISKEIEEKYPSSLMISYDGTKIITFNNGRHKFFIWNVFNLHAIVRNVLDRDGFMEMSQNLQGSFACVTPSIQNEIIIGTPLNKAESKFLDEFNVLSFIQAKFIRMVMGGTTAKTGSLEHQIFISLPEVIQALLQANPEMYYDIVQGYIAKKK